MILRFFYDGFKPNRYYWELAIAFRKFLLVMFIIIFRDQILYQIYGMTIVIQIAVLFHILLHPYTSGRQYRLEMWSLVAILCTLLLSLYIVQGIMQGENKVALSNETVIAFSGVILLVHLLVIIGFMFFIIRGLIRRFLPKTWSAILSVWKSRAPQTIKRDTPKLTKIRAFFEAFGTATDTEREKLYASLQNWWKNSPNYKRRRLLHALTVLSQNTAYEQFGGTTESNFFELPEIKTK